MKNISTQVLLNIIGNVSWILILFFSPLGQILTRTWNDVEWGEWGWCHHGIYHWWWWWRRNIWDQPWQTCLTFCQKKTKLEKLQLVWKVPQNLRIISCLFSLGKLQRIFNVYIFLILSSVILHIERTCFNYNITIGKYLCSIHCGWMSS